MERERLPRRNNRQQLLDGALQCIGDKGYARTTARDVTAASGANLASIGYHFGGVDAMLEEALGQCFETWTERVSQAVSANATGGPRAQLEAALGSVVDSYEELRPMVVACVESYAPAIRSEELRQRIADGYARTRHAGNEMLARAAAEYGLEVPPGAAALPSVIIALCDGLMLQWLADPQSAPSAAATLDALAALGAVLSE